MVRYMGRFPLFLFLAVFALATTAIFAGGGDDDDDDDEGTEIELDEASVFIEWNSTDGDFGIQVFWDGEPWTKMKVENPNGKNVLKVRTRRNIKEQGLTEGFFESAEPPVEELSMEEFFERHPEGTYEFEGKTVDGDELEGEAEFTHTLPAPPENVTPGEDDVVSKNGFTVTFDEVTEDINGDPIDIEFYIVVVEKEDDDPILEVFEVILRPGVTSVDVPGQFLDADTEYKVEIIAQEESGNRTITETGLFKTDA